MFTCAVVFCVHPEFCRMDNLYGRSTVNVPSSGSTSRRADFGPLLRSLLTDR
jgi:hypothetical protein